MGFRWFRQVRGEIGEAGTKELEEGLKLGVALALELRGGFPFPHPHAWV